MVNLELVMVMLGSIGIAASVYGHCVYSRKSVRFVHPEPPATGTDVARRLRLVSARP